MKTPYDAARRWRKDDLDQIRRELAVLNRRRDELAGRMAALDDLLGREMTVAPAVPMANFGGFNDRIQRDRAQIADAICSVDSDIAQMSVLVAEAFQAFKVLDVAAERFALEAEAELRRREQAELDELAGQRALRRDRDATALQLPSE